MTSDPQTTHPLRTRVEWPTVALSLAIYTTWILTTLYHARIGLALTILVGAWTTAWHNSLQHEIIHGHPTRWRRLNTLLAVAPLSLWLPFESYRQSHLAHHNGDLHVTERLHLVGPDTLRDDLVISAPHVLTAPWKTTRTFYRQRGRKFEIVEGECRQGDFQAQTDKDGNAVFVLQSQDDGNVIPGAK